MIRSIFSQRFSKFYRHCEFQILKDQHQDHACEMANYIHIYRRYGHLYARLDPLGLYDKFTIF